MTAPELGEAVVVYEDPHEGTVERTVPNERVAYFQDHWIVKLDEDEAGNDVVRRIPVERVHYVERSVEQFEEEVDTLRNRAESFVKDVGSTLFGDDHDDRGRGGRDHEEARHIEVEAAEGTADGSTGGPTDPDDGEEDDDGTTPTDGTD